MPLKKPTGEEIYEFRKKDSTLSWFDVAQFYGEPAGTLRKREQRYRKENDILALGIRKEPLKEDIPPEWDRHQVKFSDKGFSAEAYSVSNRITSLTR